jgi:predicted DNA-binding transcriptional regulator AlpA
MNDSPTSPLGDELLPTGPAAKMLGESVSWFIKARLRGEGPRYVKIGHSVRYPQSYLREYLQWRTQTSDQAPNINSQLRALLKNLAARIALFVKSAFAPYTKGRRI